jgi:oligoendopeptidase F
MPEAPAEQDQPVVPEAPETDQPTGTDEESFTDSYNPNEVPEELRPQLEAAYKQLQSAYTSKTQSLAQERQEAEQAREVLAALADPNRQAEVLQYFGISLADDDEENLFPEEPDANQRLDQLEQMLAAQQEQQQAIQASEQELGYIAAEIEGLEKSHGREFSAEEHQFLADIARANAAPNGAPDVQKAGELLSALYKQQEKAVLEARKAPRRMSPGSPGSKAPDLSNKEERRAAMAEAVDQLRASQET